MSSKEELLAALEGPKSWAAVDILEAAPEALRDDDACVRAAVAQNGRALRSASVRLRGDHAFVRTLLEDADCTLLDLPDEVEVWSHESGSDEGAPKKCCISEALRADPELGRWPRRPRRCARPSSLRSWRS